MPWPLVMSWDFLVTRVTASVAPGDEGARATRDPAMHIQRRRTIEASLVQLFRREHERDRFRQCPKVGLGSRGQHAFVRQLCRCGCWPRETQRSVLTRFGSFGVSSETAGLSSVGPPPALIMIQLLPSVT